MRLRFRYSLLTLLVLTALVAGGVKWWYGPHHVVMSDPPTAEEESLLYELDLSWDLKFIFDPVVYEYEYVNEWNNRKYLYLKGHSTDERPIPVYHWSEHPEIAHLMHRRGRETKAQLAFELEDAKEERVVCWLYKTSAQLDQIDLNQLQSRFPADDIYRTITNDCYFLTSRRKLYQFLATSNKGLMLKAVALSEIDDAEFRARVAAELAKIPRSQ